MKLKKDIDIHHAKVLLDQYLFEEKAYIDDGQKTPVSFTPYTITSDRYEILSFLCEKVYSAIEKLLRYFVKDQDTQALFPELIHYIRLATFAPNYKYWTFLARFDIAENQEGDFKLLETNCGCPGGFFLFPIIKKAFNKIGVFEKDDLEVINQLTDDESIFFYSLVDAYREVYKREPQNITLLTSKVHPLINEIDLMVKVGTNLGLECFHCPIQDLALENGSILSSSKKKIDLAYTKIDSFIDKETNSLKYFLYENSESEIPAFLQGIYNKQITCFNSFPSAFVGENKRILALLTDKRFYNLFSEDEREAIEKFCPKTFCLSKKDENYKIKLNDIMQNKHLYVVKSVHDTRGREVYIGRNTLSNEWENLVNRIVDAPYIIQEYVDCKKANVLSALNKEESMYSTLGMFILQGKAAGILVRSSQNEITNVVGKTGCIRASYVIKD